MSGCPANRVCCQLGTGASRLRSEQESRRIEQWAFGFRRPRLATHFGTAAFVGAIDFAEQEGAAPAPVRGQREDAAGSRGRPQASRSRDWILEHPAHLGQTLQRHPHVHCVVPGGGLSPDRQRWIRSRFFLPVRVLGRVFRGKFLAGLQRAFRRNELAFFGACLPLAKEKPSHAFLRTLF